MGVACRAKAPMIAIADGVLRDLKGKPVRVSTPVRRCPRNCRRRAAIRCEPLGDAAREGGSRRRAASQETCRRLDHPYEPGGVHRWRQPCATCPDSIDLAIASGRHPAPAAVAMRAEAGARLDPDPLGLIDAFLGAPAADAVERTYLAWLVTLAPALDPAQAAALLLARPDAAPSGPWPASGCWPCCATPPAGRGRRSPPSPRAGARMRSEHEHEDPGHHRHRLPRRRQDQPGPAPGRERRRQAAGAADQRVRRSRRRPGAARRLRHRGLCARRT